MRSEELSALLSYDVMRQRRALLHWAFLIDSFGMLGATRLADEVSKSAALVRAYGTGHYLHYPTPRTVRFCTNAHRGSQL